MALWGDIAGFILQAYKARQQYEAGKEEEKTAQKNEQLLKEMAEATRKKYAYEELQRRKQTMRLLSSQKAAAGSSGLTIGSFEPLYAETLSEGELDALAIRQQGDVESRQYQAKAETYAKAGKQAKKAGMWGAGETLLGGTSDYWESYQGSKKTKTWGESTVGRRENLRNYS